MRPHPVSRRVYKAFPPFVRKVAFEIFTIVLCLSAAVPLLFSPIDPESINAILPSWLVTVWGLALTFGPVAMLFGLVGQSLAGLSDIPFWKKIEAHGLGIVAYVGYLYALVVALNVGKDAAPAVAIILIFTLTCHFRMIEVNVEVDDFMEDIGAEGNGR